ncbi:MAG TPA: hypothetical protein PLI09_05885 [Candidatus Hydrogenedentes bacterium]|nr:hypothetical protein [Candidatus Hydrogenedentota bacterium]
MRKSSILSIVATVIILGALPGYGSGQESPKHMIYPRLLDPREHPDYERHWVKPPNWDMFGNLTQFVALRGFAVENDRIVKYAEEIDAYTKTYDLCSVVWPSYPIIFAKNLGELADEIKQRNLFLFDLWGYVPGSGPGGYWTQYRPDPAQFALLESKLGDHWLGMDNGEQDGRYIGGYAGQMHPISQDRFQQYLNFQRHFERMGDELGNKLSTLVSLNFGHYFLKEGIYTTIGAETAQALPNSQIYYAFIRGAGKQYGVPWFGNASVWNRWGWKTYGSEGPDNGPKKGTSLNLLKRLLYSHILYNSVFVGFESGWIDGDHLSPIGTIQQEAKRWVREHGMPGVMLTPIAVVTDFFAGWTFPRHLYTGDIYRVWGNLPYGPGDYLTDGVLDMLYPGYQDSSYFHDETGFQVATPYGDTTDCLLSDAPEWLLKRYAVLVITGEMSGGMELQEKLTHYVNGGGQVVITSGNLKKLPGGLCGVNVGEANAMPPGTEITAEGKICTEDQAFTLNALTFPAASNVLARCGDTPVAVNVPCGKGSLIVLASSFGLADTPSLSFPISSATDQPLPKPYPLLSHVQTVLNQVFSEQALFTVGDGLSFIVCRKAPGDYTLGICNNTLAPKPFSIASNIGEIESIQELPLDTSEKNAEGFLPEGSENAAIGQDDATTIAGGSVRMFSVKVNERGVVELPHDPTPPTNTGRGLALNTPQDIKEAILARPTFFEHFDSVLVDWRYLHKKDSAALQRESGWLARQRLRIYVDLGSGINLFPDLRLVSNDETPYNESMAAIHDVLEKMTILGAKDLILTRHRGPENNFSGEQTEASFETSVREICAQAAAKGVTVYFRMSIKGLRTPDDVAGFVQRMGAPNLRIAASLALLAHQKIEPNLLKPEFVDKIGLWLASAPGYDANGALWSVSQPLATQADMALLRAYIQRSPKAPIILDAVYTSQDEEYIDTQNFK